MNLEGEVGNESRITTLSAMNNKQFEKKLFSSYFKYRVGVMCDISYEKSKNHQKSKQFKSYK